MASNISLPQRKNLQIPEFDYSQPGAYFVTVVTQDRKMLFGHIIDGEMILNDMGKMVKEVIDQIAEHYPGINVEISVIIPNHVHILFLIADVVAGPRACPRCSRCRGDACVAFTATWTGILTPHTCVASRSTQKVQ